MPFYEYQCKNCGHALEAMQKINDAPLRKCPHCGKSQLTRLMSAPVFRLKGGGWYETDFKGDSDHKKNLADRPEAADTAKEDTKSSSDAKAADSTSKDGVVKPGDKSTEKSGDKAADKSSDKASSAKEKPAASPTKKAPTPLMSKRGATAAATKPKTGKPVKKPAAKAKGRR